MFWCWIELGCVLCILCLSSFSGGGGLLLTSLYYWIVLIVSFCAAIKRIFVHFFTLSLFIQLFFSHFCFLGFVVLLFDLMFRFLLRVRLSLLFIVYSLSPWIIEGAQTSFSFLFRHIEFSFIILKYLVWFEILDLVTISVKSPFFKQYFWFISSPARVSFSWCHFFSLSIPLI